MATEVIYDEKPSYILTTYDIYIIIQKYDDKKIQLCDKRKLNKLAVHKLSK